jgi:hypothetical protein
MQHQVRAAHPRYARVCCSLLFAAPAAAHYTMPAALSPPFSPPQCIREGRFPIRESGPRLELSGYLASSTRTRSLPRVSGVKKVVKKEMDARTSE